MPRISWLLAGIAVGLPLPALAQTGGWEPLRTQKSCYGAVREQGGQRTAYYASDGRVVVTIPVARGQAGGYMTTKAKVRSKRHPTYSASVHFPVDPKRSGLVSEYLAELSVSGDRATIDWLARENPTFDLVENGRTLATIQVSGIAQARAALAGCKPLPPPPPKPAGLGPRPSRNPADWIDSMTISPLLGPGKRVLEADLAVDAAGKVSGCTIVTSLGSAEADRVACDSLVRRARFSPATGAGGKPVPGTYRFRTSYQ